MGNWRNCVHLYLSKGFVVLLNHNPVETEASVSLLTLNGTNDVYFEIAVLFSHFFQTLFCFKNYKKNFRLRK